METVALRCYEALRQVGSGKGEKEGRAAAEATTAETDLLLWLMMVMRRMAVWSVCVCFFV